mmetsp:Transcript_8786/g.18779  ORF Transcript_8786/g.18779 Transcript_8786/m.18779 type:complete len:238 (-) Transcript_8786:847-1560(-)|eukprot:CAMPEP_0202904638 /NCGR_PEP_ID=MMETSP1392-20130828/30428_1 /ASSEMBLY_ACC=CAM_ASM_000868 /TAXON_ID=225041 /ORGANISM="Chlamydomonas chlamydogama, Strain SAG 11-48b" /LENGTH=237 /DNA_ID=CAMNT_0049592375 /DNA_START=134 /DNA_END=847 /DNA_ORIENTATION=+
MAVPVGKIVGTIVNAMLWVAWIVYLAGAAKLTQSCADHWVPSAVTVRRLHSAASDCASFSGLPWWSVWLQFACQLLSTALLLTVPAISMNFRQTSVVMYSMSTVLLFIIANFACRGAYEYRDSVSDLKDGFRVAAAGTVMCLIFNFIWIITHTSRIESWTTGVIYEDAQDPEKPYSAKAAAAELVQDLKQVKGVFRKKGAEGQQGAAADAQESHDEEAGGIKAVPAAAAPAATPAQN